MQFQSGIHHGLNAPRVNFGLRAEAPPPSTLVLPEPRVRVIDRWRVELIGCAVAAVVGGAFGAFMYVKPL